LLFHFKKNVGDNLTGFRVRTPHTLNPGYAVADDGRPAFINSWAGSLELGQPGGGVGGGGTSPARHQEAYLSGDDGTATPPAGLQIRDLMP